MFDVNEDTWLESAYEERFESVDELLDSDDWQDFWNGESAELDEFEEIDEEIDEDEFV